VIKGGREGGMHEVAAVEKVIDRAVEKLVAGVEKILDVNGRIIILERDGKTTDDAIKYLRSQLHDVRAGRPEAPGLNQLNMTNRELSMEVAQLKRTDEAMTETLKDLAEVVSGLKEDARVQAWKIGSIIGLILFLANMLIERVKF
jgi:hypothetical protein